MLLKRKKEIKDWLNQYQIKNYEIIEDKEYGYVVNVNNDVELLNKNLKNIKVKFNEVNGFFYCFGNELKSLKGCPKIVNGIFNCSYNCLTSLIDSPKIVKGNFYCFGNELKSLIGCSEIIEGDFDISNNLLTIEELKYLPKEIKSNYIDLFNNEKLGDLQNINCLNELKEKVNIFFEKNNLLNIINKKDLNYNKNKANFNKI